MMKKTPPNDIVCADVASVGMCYDRLAAISDRIQEKYIDTGKFAGSHLLVARSGKIVYDHVQGYADKETKQLLQADSLYRLFSMSKPIVAVALMQLYEQGLFSLHDPVSLYLPEFSEQTVWLSGQYPYMQTQPARSLMTIEQLLTHTSGLSCDFWRLSYVDEAYRRLFNSVVNLNPLMASQEVLICVI